MGKYGKIIEELESLWAFLLFSIAMIDLPEVKIDSLEHFGYLFFLEILPWF